MVGEHNSSFWVPMRRWKFCDHSGSPGLLTGCPQFVFGLNLCFFPYSLQFCFTCRVCLSMSSRTAHQSRIIQKYSKNQEFLCLCFVSGTCTELFLLNSTEWELGFILIFFGLVGLSSAISPSFICCSNHWISTTNLYTYTSHFHSYPIEFLWCFFFSLYYSL